VRILIKLGGTLLDTPEVRDRLASEIGRLAASGREVVVVHGGGRQMTQYLAERGVESQFVNGLRVTGPETLDAVVKVLAGSVNRELVAALVRAGARAVGLSGIDANMVEAEQMDPALGAVGRVVRAHPELVDLLLANGYLPVVACVAGDSQGRMYNVNADQMAVACASGFGVQQLLFLTDVDGVLDATGSVRPVLSAADCEGLIAEGIAKGGMRAKLDAAGRALRDGVGEIRIAPGAMPGIIERVIAGEAIGTRIAAEAATLP
jgi:acetylglutamate kinase